MSQSLSFRCVNRSLWLRGVLFSAFFLGGVALLPAVADNLSQVGGYTNQNTAVGDLAMDLLSPVGAFNQTAVGYASLYFSNGTNNTGAGYWTLLNLASGDNNTAIGGGALSGLTNGTGNIALGYGAGAAISTGNNDIHIGNGGVDGESNVIRLGNGSHTAAFIAGVNGTSVTNGTAVVVDANGQLGTASIPPSGAYLQLPAGATRPRLVTRRWEPSGSSIKIRATNTPAYWSISTRRISG